MFHNVCVQRCKEFTILIAGLELNSKFYHSWNKSSVCEPGIFISLLLNLSFLPVFTHFHFIYSTYICIHFYAEMPGVVDYLSTEISTSKQKKFPLVTFVDSPGLVDGDMRSVLHSTLLQNPDSQLPW
jgi:hypothetical protein